MSQRVSTRALSLSLLLYYLSGPELMTQRPDFWPSPCHFTPANTPPSLPPLISSAPNAQLACLSSLEGTCGTYISVLTVTINLYHSSFSSCVSLVFLLQLGPNAPTLIVPRWVTPPPRQPHYSKNLLNLNRHRPPLLLFCGTP